MKNSTKPKNETHILFGVGSFQALAMFRRGMFYAYLSVYLRYFLGMTVTETTLFATLPMVLNIFSQTFIWGKISDIRQLRRTLIIRGEFLAGIGTTVVWYLHTISSDRIVCGYVLILGLTAVEFFWSMSNVGWSALISDLYPKEERNRVQGRLASIGGIGRIAGIWIGGLLYDGLGRTYEGWGFEKGGLFFVASLVMFISIIPMWFVPEGGIRKEVENVDSKGEEETGRIIYFWIFIIAMVFINFGRNSVIVIQSQYLFLDTGFAVSSKMLSYIVNMDSAAIVFTGFFSGWIGSKIGNGKSVCLGTLISMTYLGIFILASDLRFIFAASFLRGTSEVILMSSSYAFASILIPPKKRAELFGIYNATFFLSWGIAATFIAGPLIDFLIASGKPAVFSYKMAYISALGITAVGLVIQAALVFLIIPRGLRTKSPGSTESAV